MKMWSLKFAVFSIFCVTEVILVDVQTADDTLLMVHALFRHGERVTDSVYPTDPHINETFEPIGKGELTNRGKLQEYQLGQFLRRRYDKFLGNIYTSKIMKVRSTGFSRTRMSALLVAAGLWPPAKQQIWNEQLPWIPIPVDYKPYEEDDLLYPGACQKRMKILKQQHEDDKVKELYITPYKDLMNYLEQKSGKPIKSPTDLLKLYLVLKSEYDTNYTLPEWTRSVFPEPLQSAVSRACSYFNYNPEIRKINAGYFFKKVLEDFHLKMNGNAEIPKIFLYSSHGLALGQILDALKMIPLIPEYGSVILFELHKNLDDTHVIKILYKRETNKMNLESVSYLGCSTNCSIYEFQYLIKDILPTLSYKEACQVNEK